MGHIKGGQRRLDRNVESQALPIDAYRDDGAAGVTAYLADH